MKKKVIIASICIFVLAMMSGCGSTQSDIIYGEITAIDETSVTLEIGTMEKKQFDDKNAKGASGGAMEAPSGEKPSGDMPSGEKPSGEPPSGQKPSGDFPSGDMPSGPLTKTGETKTLTATSDQLKDITVGSTVKITLESDGKTIKTIESVGLGQHGGTPGGSSDASNVSLKGANEVDATDKTSEGETLTSTNADENTYLVKNGGSLTLKDGTLTKSGDTSSADNSNFYGQNAVAAVTSGSSLTVMDTKLSSNSDGSNALFATGTGSKIIATNITINTKGDSSRGLDATYGGTIEAQNVNISTEGAHCAPIATDRGEGTITVTDGTVSAKGDGSPCIYSTGNIKATNLTGTAADSQTVVIEGKNSITLDNCKFIGAGANGVMLYQSTSGDAAEGTATLTSKNSELKTTSNGAFFYVTNTKAKVILDNTKLTFSSGNLIEAAGNSTNNWGKEGENGGDLTVQATNQELTGDVLCDKISSVSMDLSADTKLKGAIDNKNQGDVSLKLSKDSTWEMTADSYLTSLTDADSSMTNIKSNGHNVYYDSSNSANSWLDGKTISLDGGGKLIPMQ